MFKTARLRLSVSMKWTSHLEACKRQVIRLVHPGVLDIPSHLIQGPIGQDREEVDDDGQPELVNEATTMSGSVADDDAVAGVLAPAVEQLPREATLQHGGRGQHHAGPHVVQLPRSPHLCHIAQLEWVVRGLHSKQLLLSRVWQPSPFADGASG